MSKRYFLVFVLLLTCRWLSAQGANLPLGNPAYHILDRLAIKTGFSTPFTPSVKYYSRGAAALFAGRIDTTTALTLTPIDRFDLRYIFLDNNEWLGQAPFATTLGGRRVPVFPDTAMTQIEASMADPHYETRKPLLGIFYPTPANLIEVNHRFFYLRANPLIHVQLGPAQNDEQLLFLNQRGVEIRGGIDDRIYFYSQLLETQARFPDYVNDFIDRYKAVPGAGLYKPYESVLFNIDRGYDYLNGQAYLGFNLTRHVGLQFGYGRNVIGNGYRSLFLSDFSNNYLNLKLNWKIWKFHLQNIFAEMAAGTANSTPGARVVEKKYLAAHYLTIDLLPNLSFGLYEAVVFDRPNQFELNYLNPFILYRTVEQSLGSPDNVVLGLDARWNLWRRLQLYGQVLFDEFKFNELFREGRGWWANKFGVQTGLKYIDAFGVDHLDLQAEFNTVRPYTYTHSDNIANYAHYNQPLAHPLGANFREAIFLARYQPLPRLTLEGRLIRASFGEDRDTTNWGSNILLPYSTREQDYGNEIGQGVPATLLLLGLDVSYQVAHNIFLEGHFFSRNKNSEDDKRDQSTRFVSAGVRVNIAPQRWDF